MSFRRISMGSGAGREEKPVRGTGVALQGIEVFSSPHFTALAIRRNDMAFG